MPGLRPDGWWSDASRDDDDVERRVLGDEATVEGLIEHQVVRVGFRMEPTGEPEMSVSSVVGFADPPLAIPSPPIGATAVIR
jgi:hypothetical protein